MTFRLFMTGYLSKLTHHHGTEVGALPWPKNAVLSLSFMSFCLQLFSSRLGHSETQTFTFLALYFFCIVFIVISLPLMHPTIGL
jgi:hypothetical protein